MSTSSQKFIARNRAPRVQIEYDVELYGAERMRSCPSLGGDGCHVRPLGQVRRAPAVRRRPQVPGNRRRQFDDRMKSMKPRAAFGAEHG